MSLSFLLSPSFRLSLFLGRGRAPSSLGREFVRANGRRGVTARFSDAANFSGWNVRRASFGSSRVLSDLETESRFENLREERDRPVPIDRRDIFENSICIGSIEYDRTVKLGCRKYIFMFP